jgi:threonine dehydratase
VRSSLNYVGKRGGRDVHAFDAPFVIAGQGTITLEVLDHLSGLTRLIVPTGGRGMLAGAAVVVREPRSHGSSGRTGDGVLTGGRRGRTSAALGDDRGSA